MDLSKAAKKRRDQVEDPLFLASHLVDDLEECRVRINATMAVWTETSRTLEPALGKLDEIQEEMAALKKKLAFLWKRGCKSKWNVDN